MKQIIEKEGKKRIWVIDKGKKKVRIKDVRVIERKGESFVEGGVEEGRYVEIEGVNEMKEGKKVSMEEKGRGM